MVFTNSEIETLKLCALCKDLPAQTGGLAKPEVLRTLAETGMLRQSKCGLGYRVTAFGYGYLQKLGFDFERDKQYLGMSKALMRRYETAKITAFFMKCGADVFGRDISYADTENSFIPSFIFRRSKTSNMLGGTRLTGFYYLRDKMFVPYFMGVDKDGLYTDAEERTIGSELILKGRHPVAIFTADGSLDEVLDICFKNQSKSSKSTSDTFYEAVLKFRCPVAFMTLDKNGADLISIMSVPDYRGKIVRLVLMKGYEKPEIKGSDGQNIKTGENFIFGIDCNIARFLNVIRSSRETTHIILFPYQKKAVQNYLTGTNARLHFLEPEEVMKMLGIKRTGLSDNDSPYMTGGGEYAYVPPVG